jgi:hypothetical protein
MHVFNLVVLCLALVMFMWLDLAIKRDKESGRPIFIFGAFSICPLAYYAFVMLAKPGLLPGGAVRSPTPLAYLVGFAPLVLLSIVRIAALCRRRSLPRSDLFLICWIVACSVLLYSYPILSQEGRAVLGLQIPLVILSVRALYEDILPACGLSWAETEPAWKRTLATAFVTLFIAFTLPSSLYNVYNRVERLRVFPEAFSLTGDEYEALEFLGTVPGRGVVLSSSERVGSYIPRIGRKRAWMGEYDYPSYARRIAFIRTFFTEPAGDARYYEMLKERDIAFIYYGEHERSVSEFEPEDADYLEKIFQNSSVAIYRTLVDPDAANG